MLLINNVESELKSKKNVFLVFAYVVPVSIVSRYVDIRIKESYLYYLLLNLYNPDVLYRNYCINKVLKMVTKIIAINVVPIMLLSDGLLAFGSSVWSDEKEKGRIESKKPDL